MQQEPDNTEHHRRRSEFIRGLVQNHTEQSVIGDRYKCSIPRAIIQFWHDIDQFPDDVRECTATWMRLKENGFRYHLFDEHTARSFIGQSLGARHEYAFSRCYHPAMQADYFRLCYLFIEGGFYVDADDVYTGADIEWLFEDGRLKLQPLCYDIASSTMVQTSIFLRNDAYDPSWIFYFNNNPLIASQRHPIIERALSGATSLLELIGEDVFPEIQAATGPGNLSKAVYQLGASAGGRIGSDLVVLHDWESLAVSRWPLSYRDDVRNWRLANQKKFSYNGK